MTDESINQTDLAVIEVLSLLLGSSIILDEKRQEGLNEALGYLVGEFATRGQNKAAAVVEQIRLKSVDSQSDPALLNRMRKRSPGSGQSN